MSAVLQFEIDTIRVAAYPRDSSLADGSPVWKYTALLQAALHDTMKNGGTFVSKTKLTAVQRAEAEEMPDVQTEGAT